MWMRTLLLPFALAVPTATAAADVYLDTLGAKPVQGDRCGRSAGHVAATAAGSSDASTAPATGPADIFDDSCLDGAPAGYRGISHQVEPREDDAHALPAGGLATYSEHHSPVAVYSEAAGRTFFVYGGWTGREKDMQQAEPVAAEGDASAGPAEDMPPESDADPGENQAVASLAPARRRLAIMASWYDHNTGKVRRPAVVLERGSADPRGNAALALDREGHLWVFAAAQGDDEPGVVMRSVGPHDVSEFREVRRDKFFSPQAWFLEAHGFVLLHHRQPEGGTLYVSTSADGVEWSEPRPLAGMKGGHRHVSWRHDNKIGVAFNVFVPRGPGRAGRRAAGVSEDLKVPTNLYYMESHDGGRSWTTYGRERLELPLGSLDNPALVYNYQPTAFRIHVKDLSFDAFGNPSILYLVSVASADGRQSGRCYWNTARGGGGRWQITGNLLRSDNIHDSGCLHWEQGHIWRFVAPTVPGPQPGLPGGEIMSWVSSDYGRSWQRQALTWQSELNHSYVRRPVDAHPDFYALWSDGHPHEAGPSRLYYSTRSGNVFMLPPEMQEDLQPARPVSLELEEEAEEDGFETGARTIEDVPAP